MTNEYGATLDRAGYAPSIVQKDADSVCYLCGRRGYHAKLDRHEPFGGLANRKKSQQLGLWVSLCHDGCHEGPGSVHADPALNAQLKEDVQRSTMLRYGWSREEFILRMGKSFLTEEECSRILNPAQTRRVIRESKGADIERAQEIIARLFPNRGSGFQVILDGPELPY